MQAWINNPVFVVQPGWGDPQSTAKPIFADTEANKKLYGIELAKGLTPYEASKVIFPDGQGVCVWVAQNWISDPIVIAAKDQYLQAIEVKSKNIDKEQYLAKVMEFYDATYEIGGVRRFVNEGKDRLAALKLYGEAKGYVNKNVIEIDNSTTNNTNNFVGIKLVKPEPKQAGDTNNPNNKSEILNNETSLPQLKLVGGSGFR